MNSILNSTEANFVCGLKYILHHYINYIFMISKETYADVTEKVDRIRILIIYISKGTAKMMNCTNVSSWAIFNFWNKNKISFKLRCSAVHVAHYWICQCQLNSTNLMLPPLKENMFCTVAYSCMYQHTGMLR